MLAFKSFRGCVLFSIIYLVPFVLPSEAFAQRSEASAEKLTSLVERLDSLISAEFNEPLLQTETDLSTKQLNVIFSTDSSLSPVYSTRIEITEKQRELSSQDLGFQLSAGYIENLDQGVFGAEGIFYQRRVDFGLQWNILKNGLLQNRLEEERLSGQMGLLSEEAKIDRARSAYSKMQRQLKQAFTAFRISLLEDHLRILGSQQQLTAQLYELNYSDLNAVLEITSKKTATESEIQALKKQFSITGAGESKLPSPENLPALELNIETLLGEGLDFYREMNNPLADVPYQPLNEISLSTFLRYNIFGGSGVQNIGSRLDTREFISVGFSVGVPLPLGFSQKKDIHELQGKLVSSGQAIELQKAEQEVLNRYESFQRLTGSYFEKEREYTRMRDQIRKYQYSGSMTASSSPADILNKVSESYTLALELIDIKERMYLELIAIQALIPDRLITSYLSPAEDIDSSDLLSKIEGFYLWSHTLMAWETEEISSELMAAGSSDLYVSAGADDRGMDRIRTLIQSKNAPLVHLMIADANLIFPDHEDELKELVKQASETGAAGIHLDVEPHTLPEWESKKEEYLVLFTEMMRKASEFSAEASINLSVSLSPAYNEALRDAAILSDRTVMMLYGIADADRYITRLRSLDPQGLLNAIALRTEDFSDRNALLRFISDIRRIGSIRTVVIQDFNGWLKMP